MTTQIVPAAAPQATEEHAPGNRLGSFLCWAVVFADIGTSVYYTPGILYGLYGPLAGFFVILTLGVFILLTLKYAEVTQRFPEGGGVVTVTSHALSPWAGALGGMLILVDYFLTAALSSLSGITYFSVIVPQIGPIILWLTIGAVFVLGVLNWWGIKESASVSAVIAVIAFVSDLAILVAVGTTVPFGTIMRLFSEIFAGHQLTFQTLIAGYAGAFLAFSGLESISQLSPVMRVPRKKIAGWALGFVVVTVGITSPLLTVFSTTLLCAHGEFQNGLLTCVSAAGKGLDPNQFISLLGGAYGGAWLGILVAISAAALLIFASNTAIIGSYHVFLALTRMQFFPPFLTRVNRSRGTPHWAILLATAIPIAVLVGARGQIDLLGDLYAFGLLGAFTLTCLGIDILRWREAPWRGARRAIYTGPSKAHDDAELAAQAWADAHATPSRMALWLAPLDLPRRQQRVAARFAAARAALRGWPLWPAIQTRTQPVLAAFAPLGIWLRPAWSPIVFAFGVLTTLLVALAWGVNLFDKHLATEFGGGVTLAGLLVALIYQVYREVNGEPTIHPLPTPTHYKNAWLVVLPTAAGAKEARRALVQSVAAIAGSHTLIFAYLDPAPRQFIVGSMMEISDPYLRNQTAQRVLSKALITAWRAGVPRHQMHFYFATGGTSQITDIWRGFRPDETIALAGQGVARQVQVDYMRTKVVDGYKIAFYSHHLANNVQASGGAPETKAPFMAVVHLAERLMTWVRRQRERFNWWLVERSARPDGTPPPTAAVPGLPGGDLPPTSASAEPSSGEPSSHAPTPTPAPGMPGGDTIRKVLPTNGRASRTPLPASSGAGASSPNGASGAPVNGATPPPAAPTPSAPAASSSLPARSDAPPSSAAEDPYDLVPPGTLAEADQYVWTGTELKRRDELLPTAPDNQSATAPDTNPTDSAEQPVDASRSAPATDQQDSASSVAAAHTVLPITPEASAELETAGDAEPEAIAIADDANDTAPPAPPP